MTEQGSSSRLPSQAKSQRLKKSLQDKLMSKKFGASCQKTLDRIKSAGLSIFTSDRGNGQQLPNIIIEDSGTKKKKKMKKKKRLLDHKELESWEQKRPSLLLQNSGSSKNMKPIASDAKSVRNLSGVDIAINKRTSTVEHKSNSPRLKIKMKLQNKPNLLERPTCFKPMHESKLDIKNISGPAKKSTPVTETGKRNLFKRRSTKETEDLKQSSGNKSSDSNYSQSSISLTEEFNEKSKRFCSKSDSITENSAIKNDNKLQAPFLNQTNHSLNSITRNYIEDCEDDYMEWEAADKVLRSTRNEIDASTGLMEWELKLLKANNNKFRDNTLYFVVDTNVLIGSLSLIVQLICTELRGFCVIVVIPWQVLKELDKLKTLNDHIAMRARRASKFLSESLKNETYNIIFQKQSEHFEDCPQVLIEVPDDHLIKCCCQLKNSGKNVMLLSNDTNLCVKARATDNIQSASGSWVLKLLQQDSKDLSKDLHCFESEPKNSNSKCSIFLYKLTRCLHNFLNEVISDSYKRMYFELWILWLPSMNMNLKDTFLCLKPLPVLEGRKEKFEVIIEFYKEKKSYENVVAMDVDNLGRNCILLAKSLFTSLPEICKEFDKNMGFLKTGNISEQTYGYTVASSLLAKEVFQKMEDKLNSYLSYISSLASKVFSENILIPDVKAVIENINKHLIVTNEASTSFLLLSSEDEISFDSAEISIFYKVLLDFLEIKQDIYSLPLFTSSDVVMLIEQERSTSIPLALHWLSDVRRQLTEYKMVVGNH